MAADPGGLRRRGREAAGRDPAPRVGCIESQTVKGTEVGGTRGYDGGKKLVGRKRHIIVDSMGLLLAVLVTAANLDDGTHARHALARLTAEQCSRLEAVRGDAKDRNHALDAWLAGDERTGAYVVEVVERPPGSVGFAKVAKRRVVERTFAWIGRSRRNSRDYERLERSAEAMIMVGSIHRMLRTLKPDLCNPLAPFKTRNWLPDSLSPLLLDHVNMQGRYEFALKESVRQGRLRPLRSPDELDDLAA